MGTRKTAAKTAPKVSSLQEFAPLAPAVEAALRASIVRFGVLVPVVKDQHGRIIDGHHRSQLAEELRVNYRVDRVIVANDEEAQAMARTLNADRRHLTEEQRKEVVLLLASETVAAGEGGREEVARHSPEAIAGALGVAKSTVQEDMKQLAGTGQLTRPAKTLGQDGKVRPTKRRGEGDASTPSQGSRANMGPKSRRRLPDVAKEYGWSLRRDVERLERVFADDRFGDNKEKVATQLRSHLEYAVETLRGLLDCLTSKE